MKKILLSACSSLTLTAAIGFASTADAQSMDYGSLSSLFGESVTTSSTGTPQKASQVAANMTIITADDIRHNGSRNIPLLLSQVPGLDVSQTSSVGFDVGVRGYQQQMNSRLLVLIDGRQVFQDDYSRTVWENLPVDIDDIRQIEVVIGPASALFGSNAVGGVINIVTYSPLYDRETTATLAAGSRQGRQGDAVVSQSFDGGKGGIKLSAGASNANEFTTNRPNANFNVTTNKVGPDVPPMVAGASPNSNDEWPVTFNPTHRYATLTSDYTLQDDLVAELSANYSRSHSSEANYIGQINGLDDEVHSLKGGFTWQTDIGTIKVDSYWNHTRVNNYYASANYPYYADTTELYVNQIEDQFRIGDANTFRVFGEYRHTDFHTEIPQVLSYYGPNGVPSGVQDAIHENVFAAGGMWLWQITDDLSWTNAGRVDFFGLSESGPLFPGLTVPASAYDRPYKPAESANSGLVYTLTSLDTFHLTYGRAVEFPRLLDYGFNIIGLRPSGTSYRYVERVGNPDLKPTIVTNYELDYDRKLPFIDSVLSASVYKMSNHSLLSSLVGLGSIGSSTLGSSQYDLGLGNAVSQAQCSPAVPINSKPSLANGTPLLRCYGVNLGQSENFGSSSGTGAEIGLKGKNALGLRWDISYSLASVSDSKDLYTQTVNTYGLAAAKGIFFEDSAPRHHGRISLGYSVDDWEFDVEEQVLSDHVDLRFGSGYRQPVNGYNSLSGRIGYKFLDDYTLSVSGTNLTQAKTQATAFPEIERSLLVALTGKF